MNIVFENNQTKKIRIKVALYSSLFETFIEENEYFENPVEENLQITLTESQINKFEEFISLVIENKEAEGIKKFKPNWDFSHHFFKEKSDEEILDYFNISHYLDCEILHESLNIFLGGLLQISCDELNELYPLENAEELRKEAETECIQAYDSLIVKELKKIIPRFSNFALSLKTNFLSLI